MNPVRFVEKTLFLEIKVASIEPSSFHCILVGLDHCSDLLPRKTGHDDKPSAIQLKLTLEETRSAKQRPVLILRAGFLAHFVLFLVVFIKLSFQVLTKLKQSICLLLAGESDETCPLVIHGLLLL